MTATSNQHRLLIIACTATKRGDVRLLPAIDRYNGPTFRVLRRWLSDNPEGAMYLDVYILSAEFGLIPAIQLIPDYDRHMTTTRAIELRSQISLSLRQLLAMQAYASAYLCLGKVYRQALGDTHELFGSIPVQSSPGGAGIGVQLAALKQWLSAI